LSLSKFYNYNNFKFEIFHSQNDVYNTWNKILPKEHHLLSLDYLAIENSLLEGFKYYYVNVYDSKTKLIAIFYCQLVELKKENFKTQSCIETSLLKFLMGLKSNHFLICGNVFKVNQPGYFFVNPYDEAQLTDIVLGLKKEISKKFLVLGILLKDCTNQVNAICFARNSFVSFKEDITMMLKIKNEWQTISDYCDSLKRKYKQRFLKVKNSATKLEIRELNEHEIEDRKTALEKLYLNVLEKQNFTLGRINANYFVEMKKELKEKFKIFAYFKDSELLAFSSHIYYPHDHEMEIHYIGINYEYNQEFQLYFNILCDGVKSAIENKFEVLELGRTAKDAKANLGALPHYNLNYIWLKYRFLRWILRLIIKQQFKKKDNEWQNRQPFKVLES
jgi:hypothetical protein